MVKLFLVLGSLNALLAVVLGAFGAHGLEGRLSQAMLEVFETGVKYHFYHALGLLAVGILGTQLTDSSLLKIAGWCMTGGIVIFSGSLYVLSVTGIKWLGAITPIGGVGFIVGWALVAVAVLQSSL